MTPIIAIIVLMTLPKSSVCSLTLLLFVGNYFGDNFLSFPLLLQQVCDAYLLQRVAVARSHLCTLFCSIVAIFIFKDKAMSYSVMAPRIVRKGTALKLKA